MKTGRAKGGVYGPGEVVGEEVQGMLMRTCQLNVGARFNSLHACTFTKIAGYFLNFAFYPSLCFSQLQCLPQLQCLISFDAFLGFTK